MKTLFPYDTLFGDVTLILKEVRIDDQPVADRVNVDSHTVDLDRIERSDWKTAELCVTVHAPPSETSRATEAYCVAVANCRRTNNRVSTLLTADPDTPGQWHGELLVERAYWYARADLRACVTATVEGTSRRIIGSSDTWSLLFDDLPDRPVNGAIKITWVDFDQPSEDKAYLRDYRHHYVYLSIDPDEPQLFLNRSFDGLEQLLTDRRRRGRDKALHDQTRASIADKTWSALFNAALDAVEGDDETEELEWPSVDWQRNVLESLLSRMYPDKSPEEALHDAWTVRNRSGNPGTLQELLAPAATMQVRAPRLLRDGIRSTAADFATDEEE